MRFASLPVALALVVTTPDAARACLCEVVVAPAGAPVSGRQWRNSTAIFVGTALTVDPPDVGARPLRSRWVVDASWRGEMPDTVTLVSEATGCASVIAGMRNIVLADWAGAVLDAGRCSRIGPVTGPAAAWLFDSLGAPNWTPSPFPTRPVDARVVKIGESPPDAPDVVRLHFGFPDRDLVSRVEIANRTLTGARHDVTLPAGLYRVRITMRNDEVTESYVEVRCDERIDQVGCVARRFIFGWHHQSRSRR